MDMKLAIISFLFSVSVFAYTHNISIENMKFVPDSIEAKAGDTVVFTNKSTMQHNVVSPENKIRSPWLKKGDEFKLKLDKKVDINYYCEPHRGMGMKGVIRVK